MTWLTYDQLFAAAKKAGCWNATAETFAGLALAETGKLVAVNDSRSLLESVGDKDIVDSTWWWSYGPWQIRSKRNQKGTGGLRDQERLERFDLDDHARIARAIVLEDRAWRKTGFEGWSTYTSGAYFGYIPGKFIPVPALPAGSYRVKGGDTLGVISRRLGYNLAEMVRVNRLDNPDLIRAGAVLMLPDWPYAPEPGETWTEIAADNDITPERLARYNGVTEASAMPAAIKIPRLP